MLRKFLIINKQNVRHVSQLGTPFIIGGPSVTALGGLTDMVSRRIGVDIKRFGIVYHSYRPLKQGNSHISRELFCNMSRSKAKKTPYIVDKSKADINASFVFEIDLSKSIEKEDEDIIEMLYDSLPCMRFASGNFVQSNYNNIKMLTVDDQTECPVKKICSILKYGYFMRHRKDIMSSIDKEKKLEDYIDLFTIYKTTTKKEKNQSEEEKETIIYSKKNSGWIVPMGIGYSTISNFSNTRGGRLNDFGHAFVENVYSVVEYCSLRKIQSIDDILWHRVIDNDNGMYYFDN